MINHIPMPFHGKPERRHVYNWMRLEEGYVTTKFEKPGQPRDDDKGGLPEYDLEMFWERQIVQYLDRAKDALASARRLRAIEDHESARHLEMKAQQALIKCLMTVKGCVESTIRVYGPLPKPGVSSGNVYSWEDPVYVAALEALDD